MIKYENVCKKLVSKQSEVAFFGGGNINPCPPTHPVIITIFEACVVKNPGFIVLQQCCRLSEFVDNKNLSLLLEGMNVFMISNLRT